MTAAGPNAIVEFFEARPEMVAAILREHVPDHTGALSRVQLAGGSPPRLTVSDEALRRTRSAAATALTIRREHPLAPGPR